MKIKIITVLLFMLTLSVFSQQETSKKDTVVVKKDEYDKILKYAEEYLKDNSIDTLGVFKLKNKVSVYDEIKESTNLFDVDSAAIEIKDGLMKDILIRVKFPNDSIVNFRNTYPISLVKYNDKFFKWKLYSPERKFSLSLFKVLIYDYYMSKNYISNKKNIRLKIENNKQSNKEYLIVKNNLNGLIDFRVYSDFLGLINESENGIVNFQAKSKLYLNYANFFNTHFFKTVTPFVSYSRFDNDDRRVEFDSITNTINQPLQLIQKQYLKLGVEINLFEFKHSKNAFFTASVPLRFNYGLVELDIDNNKNSISSGVFSYGTGLEFDVKRIENFGLRVGVFYDRYRQKLDDAIELNVLKDFSSIGTGAELYFYDDKDETSAIFLRLEYKELLSNLDGNFASIQFGYKTDFNLSGNKK